MKKKTEYKVTRRKRRRKRGQKRRKEGCSVTVTGAKDITTRWGEQKAAMQTA